MAASSSTIKERIRAEYATLLDNFTNLMKASKIRDPSERQAGSPGDMLEVFVEKMLAACTSLLAITSELKRNALLNDIPTRNAEVLAARQAEGDGSGGVGGAGAFLGQQHAENGGAVPMDTEETITRENNSVDVS